MKITEQRENQLIELVGNNLDDALDVTNAFDYHKWDGLIECEELLSAEELDWVDRNFSVQVRLIRNKPRK